MIFSKNMDILVMLYIVGSGPAGVSCAKALLDRGFTVTMLDAGIELEKEKQLLLENFDESSSSWDYALLQQLKGKPVTNSAAPLKLSYGSDYLYQKTREYLPIQANHVRCQPSFAKGGLSTVWGSSLMPYLATELEEWPISISDLAPYYQKVLTYLPMASAAEDLSDILPFYREQPQTFQLSRQADYLLKKFKSREHFLATSGLRMGSSRLAVEFMRQKSSGCEYCGMCLYGCPRQLIYCASRTLHNDLLRHAGFTYIPNVVVKRLHEKNGLVTLFAENHLTRKPCTFTADKVFLACGVISSSKIMLSSMQIYNHPITIKDSQHFFVPCLMFKRYKNLRKEKLHTLCQLYLEIINSHLSDKSVHVQIYTYNDLFEEEFSRLFGGLYKYLKRPLKVLSERMILIKGFMHSSNSASIKMQLMNGEPEKIMLFKDKDNPQIRQILRVVLWKLFRNSRLLGFVPLLPMAKLTFPGAANHYGGTFPMAGESAPFTSDTLGRPQGYHHVHIVDASILPSITAQSPTLTIMANAYRIGSEITYEAFTND